jgi:hypothetical protein
MAKRPTEAELLGDFTHLSASADLKRSAKRCSYFLSTFEEYNSRLVKIGLKGATMNRILLGNAVESYFLDIHRVKVFHGMEKADRHKVAAYSVKWLSKIKPIQVPDFAVHADETDLQKRLILINADFALMNALIFAKVDRRKIDDESIYTDWLYTAHYRYIDGGVLAQMFEAAARAWPAETPD